MIYANPGALRQAPPVRMPMPLKALAVLHALFAFYLVDRDVMSFGPLAAAPMFAAMIVAAMIFLHPGRAARWVATALSVAWMFTGYALVFSLPILLILWGMPSVRAYLVYSDEWRATEPVVSTARHSQA